MAASASTTAIMTYSHLAQERDLRYAAPPGGGLCRLGTR